MPGLEKLNIMNFYLILGKINGSVEPLNYMEPDKIYEKKNIFMARVIRQVNWEVNLKRVKLLKPNLRVDPGVCRKGGTKPKSHLGRFGLKHSPPFINNWSCEQLQVYQHQTKHHEGPVTTKINTTS